MSSQKAVFIVYNQALSEQVGQIVSLLGLRGFTRWAEVLGTGSVSGEPHLGTHVWPAINSATLVVGSAKVTSTLMERLRELDARSPEQGLRAFVWTVEESL